MAKRNFVDFGSWFDFNLHVIKKRKLHVSVKCLTIKEVIRNLASKELEEEEIINRFKDMSIKDKLGLGSTKLPKDAMWRRGNNKKRERKTFVERSINLPLTDKVNESTETGSKDDEMNE